MRNLIKVETEGEDITIDIEKQLIGIKTCYNKISLLFSNNEALILAFEELQPEDAADERWHHYWKCKTKLIDANGAFFTHDIDDQIKLCKRLGLVEDEENDDFIQKILKMKEEVEAKRKLVTKQKRYEQYLKLKEEFDE